jgi:hypothetical protein
MPPPRSESASRFNAAVKVPAVLNRMLLKCGGVTHRGSSAVYNTACISAPLELAEVASTDRSKKLSLNAAVESTDRSLSRSTAGKLCSPIDGARACRGLRLVGGVRDSVVSVMSHEWATRYRAAVFTTYA